jgi:ribulose-5-phosphate 4-epimerase/fuculose-1-phosphate aldolase
MADKDNAVTRRDFVALSAAGVATAFMGEAVGQVLGSDTTQKHDQIQDLVTANHILADFGIVDAFGHVSIRKDADRYLLARHVAPALVTADDILEYDLDSRPINGKGQPEYLEKFIHGEIYRARPDVMAVVHSHSAAVIPFSLSNVPLRAVFHMAAFVGEGIPIFDSSRVSKQVLVATPESGRSLAQTLADKPAALMLGHGVAIVGKSLPMAVGRSIFLENSARIQSQAIALGGSITYLDPEAAHRAAENSYGEHSWEVWKQKAEKNNGSCAAGGHQSR